MSDPMAGPTIREAFIWTELSEMAPERSSRGTSTGTTALKTGAYSALPMPMQSTTSTIRVRLGSAGRATAASSTEKTACCTLRVSRTFLRSKESASMPPTTENRSRGPSWAAVMMPTNTAEPVRL
jgi:hypothetical protein